MKSSESRAPRIGRLLGIPVMLVGIVGALVQADATRPVQLGVWLVGADVLHDALVAPAACVVGWLLTRLVPRVWRAPLGTAIALSGVLVAIAWAPLRGSGRLPDNPSLQPLDYRTSVATAVAIVWGACALWGAARFVSTRAGRAPTARSRHETA